MGSAECFAFDRLNRVSVMGKNYQIAEIRVSSSSSQALHVVKFHKNGTIAKGIGVKHGDKFADIGFEKKKKRTQVHSSP
jgi:hypothetical protein